jgi:hypothetical protein
MKIRPILGQTLFLGLLILVGGISCQAETEQSVLAIQPKTYACSPDVLRSYMIKGRPNSTPDPMILCPDIKTNCCTKIDMQHIYHTVKDILPARFAEYRSKVKMVLARLKNLHKHILKAKPAITGNAKRRLFCNRQAKKVYDFPLEDLYTKVTEELELLSDDSLEHYQKFYCLLCDGENHPFMLFTAKTPSITLDIDFCEEFLTKRKDVLRILNVELVRYLAALQHMVDCTHYVTSYDLDFFNQAKLLLAAQTDKCLDFLGTKRFQSKCEKVCQRINFSKITQMIDGDYEFLNDAVSLFEKYLDYKETGNFISGKLRAFFKGISLPRELDQQHNLQSADQGEEKATTENKSEISVTANASKVETQSKKQAKKKRKLKKIAGLVDGQEKTHGQSQSTQKSSKKRKLPKRNLTKKKATKSKAFGQRKTASKIKLNKKGKKRSSSKTNNRKLSLTNKNTEESPPLTKSTLKSNKRSKDLVEASKLTNAKSNESIRLAKPSQDKHSIVIAEKNKDMEKSNRTKQQPSLKQNRILESLTLERKLPDSPKIASDTPTENPPAAQKLPPVKKPKVTAKFQFDPELFRFYNEIILTTQNTKPEFAENIFKIQEKPIDFDHPIKKFEKDNGVNPEKYTKLNFEMPKESFYKELYSYRESDVFDSSLAYFLIDFTPDFLKKLRIDLRETYKIDPRNFEISPPKKKKTSQRILLEEWIVPTGGELYLLRDDSLANNRKEVV